MGVSRSSDSVLANGCLAIGATVIIGTVVALVTHPELRPKASDAGDGLGLLVGLVLYGSLFAWYLIWRVLIHRKGSG